MITLTVISTLGLIIWLWAGWMIEYKSYLWYREGNRIVERMVRDYFLLPPEPQWHAARANVVIEFDRLIVEIQHDERFPWVANKVTPVLLEMRDRYAHTFFVKNSQTKTIVDCRV